MTSKMISLVNLLVIASCLGMTHGMKCEWPGRESNNPVSGFLNSCPGVLDGSDKEYCCVDTHGNFQCCNFVQFFLTYIIIAVAAVAVLSLLCCLISCCCCPCCCLYKKRHGMPV